MPPAPPPAVECNSTSFLLDGTCQTFAQREDARATTPFVDNGDPVTLEVVLFKPLNGSRFPLLVVNHGSTGFGNDPALFDDTYTNKSITRFFVERGWMVAFPQRRGRGQSDGLYDEGFLPDRSAYTCETAVTLAGAARALDDIDAATDWLLLREDVDTTRVLLSGTSRGGILTIAALARRPEVFVGGINFVGGWLGEGCSTATEVNQTLLVDGAAFGGTSLWLYGNDDSFYSIQHSQDNFNAFTGAGGMGQFVVFTRAPGLNGHFIINDSDLWGATVSAYLTEAGLP
ncbi:MAG: prolyl oligopeptidase family serine peptidase [Gammaproteobacteria bacterium]|nr:prolyl oligopeptidase family serine peptidase [Gammaproteobacteria bacterium]